ncbi:MAG: ArsR/SmtB family transcription factor [candidate division WOR-3 bacterium]
MQINNLLAKLLEALAHPVRLEIVRLLSRKALQVNEIARHFPIDLSVVSRHLRILETIGVLRFYRQGRNIFYQLTDRKVLEILKVAERIVGGKIIQRSSS